jgi:hypothetical protein
MPGWHCGSNGIGLSSTFPMPREPASYPRAPAPHSRSSAPSPPALAPGRYGSAFVIAIARTALPFRVFSIAVRNVWKTLSSNFPGRGERVDHAALYAVEKILDCRTQPCVAGPKKHCPPARQHAPGASSPRCRIWPEERTRRDGPHCLRLHRPPDSGTSPAWPHRALPLAPSRCQSLSPF